MAPDVMSTRPLIDKLGVKPDGRVHLVGTFAPEFAALLRQRTANVHVGESDATMPADMVFLAADSPAELDRLARLRRTIKPAGAIWVVSRKGKGATLRDTEVIAAVLAAGLVDNKVVSFSDTHTALRAVIRLRDR